MDSSSSERESEAVSAYHSGSTRRSLIQVGLIFVVSLGLMAVVFWNFPELDEEDRGRIKLPRNIDDAKELGRFLSKYKDSYYYTVLSAFFLTYIFLQTFAIPGSIFLSILSGYLFNFFLALFLVCLCSSIGASFCYILSALIGRPIIAKYFSQRVSSWKLQVQKHRSDFLNYIVFLRITPFLPNWFINIASPVIGVPLTPFFVGTFIGVAPPSFLFIRAGTTLYEMTSATGHISWASILILALLALISLLPVFFKRTLIKKLS
jgi:uncharacterized membrane protein YdjX (TVP38/TMEM64 family)